MRRILVFGYGNPFRQDDGLGPAVAEGIGASAGNEVRSVAAAGLTPEDAAHVAGSDYVVFVDAEIRSRGPFGVRIVASGPAASFTSHALAPEALLTLGEIAFGSRPKAWQVGVQAFSFDPVEGLTPGAEKNRDAAIVFINRLIRGWEEQDMADEPLERKTILIIDDDPDLRAALRVVLESAGFSVGEAVDGEGGLKIADRIRPDAILLDLMMETVDAGSRVSLLLKESGYAGPIYLLSSVGEAVRYNLDLQELGLAGIFQKPVDYDVLIRTLRTKLKQ